MTRPNAKRTAKMRNLTLTDAAWAVLTELARTKGSRSAVVEEWLLSQTPAAYGAAIEAQIVADVEAQRRWLLNSAPKNEVEARFIEAVDVVMSADSTPRTRAEWDELIRASVKPR
jgi:hypothetical protein